MSSPFPIEGRIGRYQLLRRLAVGGMADIWLAQQQGPRGYERTVVVKTIRADLVDEEDLINMLLEEARIARCLKHDSIVELYEIGEEDQEHFLAMEFVFGRDLRQIRDRCLEQGTRIPYQHLVTMMVDVLDALYYAHHDAVFEGRPLRVIHRDVSPQNVIVGFDGTVKLLDFGIAKAAAQLSRTRAGVLKGKYAYMSPEQVDFKELDQRADVFSAGIVLWEMLTMRRLFYRNGEYETVKAVMACEVPFPRALRKDIPWPLSWIAYRALRRSPRWRYRDARKMRDALLRWDTRSREQAKDELSQWMSEVYAPELRLRETALTRARRDPARLRQMQDAGFELIDDPRVAEPRGSSGAGAKIGPPPAAAGTSPSQRIPAGLIGLVTTTVSSWRWFMLIFGAIVFLGIATGVYFGSLQGRGGEYGYLSIDAPRRGVRVSVGGRDLGEAPIRRVVVIPGRHRVIARLGDQEETIEVEVGAGDTQRVDLSLGR